jgi:hypothetical protein
MPNSASLRGVVGRQIDREASLERLQQLVGGFRPRDGGAIALKAYGLFLSPAARSA